MRPYEPLILDSMIVNNFQISDRLLGLSLYIKRVGVPFNLHQQAFYMQQDTLIYIRY